MIPRPFWLERIQHAWKQAPIMWLSGVRRVGKTSLARSMFSDHCVFINCDTPAAAQQTADPEFFYSNIRKSIVIFDEVHQLPDPSRLLKIGADVFPHLKILATGSSTLAASRKFRDTLTGRKRMITLRPVLFSEQKAFNCVDLQTRLLRGGLPEVLLAEKIHLEFYSEWLDSYFARDIQELFNVGKRHSFLGLLNHLFCNSGGLLDISNLSRQLQISRPTVMHYLDAYETTHTFHLLRPFHGGRAREWTHQPKGYAFDTGFVCFARDWDRLRSDDCGILWEHLVLDTLLSVCDPAKVHFWRDKQNREIDFVVPRGRQTCDAIECKWQGAAFDTRNLLVFRAAYSSGRNFVVTPQPGEPYSARKDGLELTFMNPAHLMEVYSGNMIYGKSSPQPTTDPRS